MDIKKISPNYCHNPKCYYCGINNADPKEENIETLYKIVKLGRATLSVNYLEIKVGIPRCKKCSNRHFIAMLPFLVSFIAFSIWFGYWLFSQDDGWADHWYSIALGLLLISIVSLLATAAFGFLARFLISLLWKETKYEGDTSSYNPIRKLKGMGFQSNKPDPAGSRGAKSYFDKNRYISTLEHIRDNDDCILEE